MSTQSIFLLEKFTIYTQSNASGGISYIMPKDSSPCRQEELAFEPSTVQLVDNLLKLLSHSLLKLDVSKRHQTVERLYSTTLSAYNELVF